MLWLVLLALLQHLGACLHVKTQTGRELVALAALAPILDIIYIHYRFQFFMPS
jgi:hypothetical protein